MWPCVVLGRALDLVEVGPEAHPPVCKMLTAQQFKYETAKARVRAQYKHVELEIRDNQIKEKE
jgi:translation initiation factor IF-3